MLRLRLVIEDDEGKTTVVPLIRDEITIGRMEGNTIRLTERNVSRRHARLLRAGGNGSPAVLVEDLDSYNGVRLNGDRIAHQCTIRPGDLIQIGDYALALRADEPAGAEVADAATAVQKMPPEALDQVPTALHQVDAELPDEKRGKLVVVSSNLQGTTFHLNRREVIIGRTAENDVVVNHRSISRNHAKIIFRDDKFTIIDLASSNGVKVNSEPFGTASLVNGDIVELGHVKMRYVAPGDDYVFSPADIDDVDIESSFGGGRLALVLVVLFLVAVAAFFLVRRDTTKPPAKTPAGTQVTPAPPPPVEPPPERPQVDVAALMAEGKSFLDGEKWNEAANIFGRVLQADPEHAEAQALKEQAGNEAENKRKYDQVLEDIDEGQWTDAFFALEDFPQESVYAPKLAKKRHEIQEGFATGEYERGVALVRDSNLDGARKVQAALAQKPFASKQARDLAGEIEAAERVARAPEPEVRPPDARRPPPARPRPERPRARPERPRVERPRTPERPEKPVAKPAKPEGDGYQAAMDQALKFLALGQRAKAITLLEKANRLRPGSKFPHQRLCAICPHAGQPQKGLRHCKLWLAKETNSGYKPAIKKKIQQLEDELNR